MTRRAESRIRIPREDLPRCECGELKVCVYRDGIEPLIDNMGCELGLELIAGPFCPRCAPDGDSSPSSSKKTLQ